MLTIPASQPTEKETRPVAERKVYQKPAIIFEQELEARAGSPLSNWEDALTIDENR